MMLEAQGSYTLQPAHTETMAAIEQLIEQRSEYLPEIWHNITHINIEQTNEYLHEVKYNVI